jgi:hypothetical protein
MLCPRKFNSATIDALGSPRSDAKCECEKEKCALWMRDPVNLLKGECAEVAAAKGLAALASLAKVFGK